jgi:hypothetical protein
MMSSTDVILGSRQFLQISCELVCLPLSWFPPPKYLGRLTATSRRYCLLVTFYSPHQTDHPFNDWAGSHQNTQTTCKQLGVDLQPNSNMLAAGLEVLLASSDSLSLIIFSASIHNYG